MYNGMNVLSTSILCYLNVVACSNITNAFDFAARTSSNYTVEVIVAITCSIIAIVVMIIIAIVIIILVVIVLADVIINGLFFFSFIVLSLLLCLLSLLLSLWLYLLSLVVAAAVVLLLLLLLFPYYYWCCFAAQLTSNRLPIAKRGGKSCMAASMTRALRVITHCCTCPHVLLFFSYQFGYVNHSYAPFVLSFAIADQMPVIMPMLLLAATPVALITVLSLLKDILLCE